MNAPGTPQPTWRLERTTPSPCWEWSGFGVPPTAPDPGAERPGAVCAGADGRTLSLHPAIDRWLLPDGATALSGALSEAQARNDGVLIDVTGKWVRLRFVTTHTGVAPPSHPLAAGLPIELLLGGRDCAATWAFDCPVVIARCAGELEIWIEASYESSFVAMLATLGVAV